MDAVGNVDLTRWAEGTRADSGARSHNGAPTIAALLDLKMGGTEGRELTAIMKLQPVDPE